MTTGAVREDLPAWSLPAGAETSIAVRPAWPEGVARGWLRAGLTGAGARVCVLDSGVESGHPMVGAVARSVAVSVDDEGEVRVEDDDRGDTCGHGTACAGIIRSIAPDCELTSVRVLGAGFTGGGNMLIGGMRWAVEQGFDVINMSLSTSKQDFAAALHEIADTAYFKGTVIVASAHNLAVESYPWKFASVLSVGSHEGDDPHDYYFNPSPPVEFFARGLDVEVAWRGGKQIRSTGNSFATPHISGMCALVLGRYPELTPFQVKSILYLSAANVGEGA